MSEPRTMDGRGTKDDGPRTDDLAARVPREGIFVPGTRELQERETETHAAASGTTSTGRSFSASNGEWTTSVAVAVLATRN